VGQGILGAAGGRVVVVDVTAAFASARDRIYLDAATYGLPPTATVRAMRRALLAWQRGTGRWIEDWDVIAEECRASFASLIGASAGEIALEPAVSVAVAAIAASLRSGDEVVVPEDEFTSVLYPLLVAERRGVGVRQVPLPALPDAIRSGTTLVATSLVQMQTGLAAPLAGIVAAARAHGTRILIDATQAVPMMPSLRRHIGDIDYLVCSGYKHLLCPRGTAFLYVRGSSWDTFEPIAAGWRAGDLPYGRYFGGPLQLAPDAARFNVSLAWFSWVGARESLRLLTEWDAAGAFEGVRAQSARLAAGLGDVDAGTTLVCVPVRDGAGLARALMSGRIRAAMRGGSLRLSPHVYNTDGDIEQAIEVVRPYLGT
jgi:selenocysteine lyase/cysteine desulfurase